MSASRHTVSEPGAVATGSPLTEENCILAAFALVASVPSRPGRYRSRF
jgi:hypothetical protein